MSTEQPVVLADSLTAIHAKTDSLKEEVSKLHAENAKLHDHVSGLRMMIAHLISLHAHKEPSHAAAHLPVQGE